VRQAQTRGLKVVITVSTLALLVGLLSATALGLFTDADTVGANAFSTGTIDLVVSPTSAVVTFTGMVPGDQVTAPLTVTNGPGGAQLRYAASSTTTENTLAGQLQLTVKSGVTTCTSAGFGGSGTVLYGPAALGNTAPLAIIGNAAQGAQAGDRTLAVGASEALCFNVSLPIATGNAFQNLSTTATFTFDSEQTANNP
jgi:hypothetical protein